MNQPTLSDILTVFWSILWRSIILISVCIFLANLISFVGHFLFQIDATSHSEIHSFPFGTFFMTFFPLLLCILGSWWIINHIPFLHYSSVRVSLNYGLHSKRFGLFDTLCFFWSWKWRALFVRLFLWFFLGVIALVFPISALMLPFPWTASLASITPFALFIGLLALNLEIIIAALSFLWLIKRKQTGRYMHIEKIDINKDVFKNV